MEYQGDHKAVLLQARCLRSKYAQASPAREFLLNRELTAQDSLYSLFPVLSRHRPARCSNWSFRTAGARKWWKPSSNL